jgi:hypothetical protein
MKRVTVLFDDEELYRSVKAEAAREGRPVKDVFAEALTGWLRGRNRISPERVERRRAALKALDEIRARQPRTQIVNDLIDEIRQERS